MRQISKNEVLQELCRRRSAGQHVDDRLVDTVNNSNALYIITLRDELSFSSLIWWEADESRCLTPAGKSRTLLDITMRMTEKDWSFADLTSNLGLNPNEHKPEWFKPCLKINEEFNYELFGWIAVIQADDVERKQSPHGSFSIYDGVHKTLVLSNLLSSKKLEYKPVGALFILPRPL